MSDERAHGSGEDREELAYLLGGVRTLLGLLSDSGADELPSDPEALRRLDRASARSGAASEHARSPAQAARAFAAGPSPHSAEAEPSAPQQQPAAPLRASPQASPFPPSVPAPHAPQRAATAAPRVPLPVLDRAATRTRLDQLAEVASTCTRCALHHGRTRSVFARGNPETELMFVGEGPGQDEDAQGLPFVGKAGQLLDKMIEAMGYRPDDVYIANIVKCRPPENRKPEPPEMASCLGYLHEQIALVRPKVIVALGATASEGLLNVGGITRLRGTWRLYRGEIPVMPTFHPAYLLRKPEDKRLVWSDLQQVMTKLGKSPARR